MMFFSCKKIKKIIDETLPFVRQELLTSKTVSLGGIALAS